METMVVSKVSLQIKGMPVFVDMPADVWDALGNQAELACVLVRRGDSRDESNWLRQIDVAEMLCRRLNGKKTIAACKQQVFNAVKKGKIRDNGRPWKEKLLDPESVKGWILDVLDGIDDGEEEEPEVKPGKPSVAAQRKRLGLE